MEANIKYVPILLYEHLSLEVWPVDGFLRLAYRNINSLKTLESKRMNLAKVAGNGQVTVPVEIRRKLNRKERDKLLFIELDGEIIIRSAFTTAIVHAQETFAGVAKAFGVADSDAVQEIVA